ncbi:kinase domain protein, putative (macronuclear) [Tetrahymena thermophila SB210]|uniref:Kinase domain protein, putative n=1 Tax=Tetrahymena thermophila (strain SB210) TaxID=312017 RepID=Q22VZ5_TETTS|nr:kinase domain protein, putative [Tetrahymena thermophila SB210]EAR89621.1 kinase domain protein, putative [Tetrahymena thermophila SB210]|eukprot:XP_001009867.1 kinase domain protein, putative [Tetrahymena thermophila SB210]
MGANQSVDLLVGEKFEETSFNLRNDTHLVREMNTDLYGESQLMQYKESLHHPYLVLKSRLLASKSEYEEFIKEPQKRKNMRSPYLIPLLNIYQIKQQDYCSKYFKVYMLYAYCEKTLFDAMIEMNELQQTFKEQEIIQMIENVLQGLIFLKQNGISHDTIKASTIAIANNSDSQNVSGIADYLCNSYKKVNTSNSANKQANINQDLENTNFLSLANVKYQIADSKFMHNGKDAYTSAILGENQDFYLSPQLFTRLKHRYVQGFNANKPEEQRSNEVSQVFSLGLVAIEMATLKSVRKIYDFDYYSLNKGKLLDKLGLISNLYSPQLAYIIAKMITFSEKDRFTFNQTLDYIHNYQQNPQQFHDIDFIPSMILENYNAGHTEADFHGNASQNSQVQIKTLEDEDDLIKRARQNALINKQGDKNFDQQEDAANNINIIRNSNLSDEQIKSRSKSPSITPSAKENYQKDFATPNKNINNVFTPGQTNSSQHQRGLSTALHNQNSYTNQKNTFLSPSENLQRSIKNSNPQYSISEYNNINTPQQYQPESDSQLRFHRDEVLNSAYQSQNLISSSKNIGRHSQKPSNPQSKIASQDLSSYDQPDFKLDKEYEKSVDFQNTVYYNKMRPTEPLDQKKYSHQYSQSLIASSLNNTIKAQSNPYTSQNQKVEYQINQNKIDQNLINQQERIKQSSQSHNLYSKNLSEILNESNNIQFNNKFPNNSKSQFISPQIHNDNSNIKINPPQVNLSPKQNNQEQKYQMRLPSQKSLRSESLIGSHLDIDQQNQKYSLKFSPKNISHAQQSPNFFKSQNQTSELKRSAPSKSVHVSNPSELFNQNGQILNSDQFNRNRQHINKFIQQPLNQNMLQVPQKQQYYFKNQNSHNSSAQQNEDSVQISVANETDMNKQEYPQQMIYNFDAKLIQDTKDRQLFVPQQSQYLQMSNGQIQGIQSNGNKMNMQNFERRSNMSEQNNSQVNLSQNLQNVVESSQPNHIQSTSYNQLQKKENQNIYQSKSNTPIQQSQNQLNVLKYSQRLQNQDIPIQQLKSQNLNNNYLFQSSNSIAIAHNLINGSGQIDQSNSIKEQPFIQPPVQNVYQFYQDKSNNVSQTDRVNIKSIIKEKNTENMLDNSLIDQNLLINGPPTPRKSIRGSKNMYRLYEKSPNKDDLHYKLEKVSIPEEEYSKDVQQTIKELEQKIKDFDNKMQKQKMGTSQQEMYKNSQEEQQSAFQKFLSSFSCKTNQNVIQDQQKQNTDNMPTQKTPLKYLFTEDRISPERFPISEDEYYNHFENRNSNSQQRLSPNPYSNSRQNSFYNTSMNQRQNISNSKSPVQNSRDMKAFFQKTAPFAENYN